MRAKTINAINEGGAFKSKRHYVLGTTLSRASEDKFEEIVHDIWPDITGDIFSKNIVQIANRAKDEDIDGYIDRLNEWGGAGFSMGSSIFPTNRGGQMNKGGFGGASNLGGPNMMYTYEIKPLNRLLQPKPSESDPVEEIHSGNYIEGLELNKKDGEYHRGTVLQCVKAENGTLMYYLVLTPETGQKMKIDPTTAVLLSGEEFIDSDNYDPSRDEADLVRAGQENNESYRAKTVNE